MSILDASLHDDGCGTVTAMRVIVAEELGLASEQVSAREADSETTPYDAGCYASRMIYVCGAVARATAVKLKERLVQAAADLLDVLPGAVSARACAFGSRDDPDA